MDEQAIIEDDLPFTLARTNPVLLDWMQHAQRLANERLSKERDLAKKHPDRANLRRWTYRADCVNDVLKAVMTGELSDNPAELNAWYQYMVRHAMLQVKRYAGEIAPEDFYDQCRQLRERRRETLKAIYAEQGEVA